MKKILIALLLAFSLNAIAFLSGPSSGGGGGAVDSVNGQTGVVVLDKSDVGLGNVPDTDATDRASHTGSQAISTVTGLQTALDAKAARALPATSQLVFVNSVSGSDVTCPATPCGDGSLDRPYASVINAMSTISDATQNKPYAIMLLAGRQIETGDLFIKPYVSIVGSVQRATYFRVNSGQIKPHSSHSTGTSWVALKNLYLGGGTVINWDLQALGGSNNVFVIEDCTTTGSITFKGRNSGGGDYVEVYGGVQLSTVLLDSTLFQLQNWAVAGAITVTNTQASAGLSGTMIGVTAYNGINLTLPTVELTDVRYPGTSGLTTTGTITVSSYYGVPPVARRTLSGGTTLNQADQ